MSNTPDQIDTAIDKAIALIKFDIEYATTHGGCPPAVKTVNRTGIAQARAAIKLLLLKARKDEIGNLGYDKRLDDPILYLEGDKVISRADRIKSLEEEMKGLEG